MIRTIWGNDSPWLLASGLSGCVLLLALLCGGCGQNDKEKFPARDMREPDLEHGGTLSGTVFFAGEPPRRRRIEMASDGICHYAHGGKPVLAERVVVTDGRLRDVLVHVTKGLEQWTFPYEKTPAVLDQEGCVYVPHVLALRCFQPLIIKNSDDTVHNVNTTDSKEGQGFNRSMAGKGSKLHWQFRKPELLLRARCNIHPWMTAWIHVLDHPYFCVTGETGRYALPLKLPPGRYTVEALHPRLGSQEQEVEIEEGGAAELDFTFRR